MRWPSIVVVNWGNPFSVASCARQSYSERQYSASSFRYPSGTPRLQPTPGDPAGQRVRASRSRRSSTSAWGTSIRKARTSLSERSGPVMGLVSLLRSRPSPVWRVGLPYDRMLS